MGLLSPFSRKPKEINPNTTPAVYLESGGSSLVGVDMVKYMTGNSSIPKAVQERHAGSDLVSVAFGNLDRIGIEAVIRRRELIQKIRKNNTPRISIYKEGVDIEEEYEDMEFVEALANAAVKADIESGNLLTKVTQASTVVESRSTGQQVQERGKGFFGFLGL